MLALADLPPADRPRERLAAAGSGALSDVELVTLIFGARVDTAAAVVARFGGAVGLGRATLRELRAAPGVGLARACALRAAVELGARALGADVDRGAPVRTAAAAIEHFRDLAALEQEELHLLGLDARHRPLARHVVARGTLNVVHVNPRDVYRLLLREGAAAVLVAHNHPSGDPSPSAEDAELTARLRAGGDLVGVPLLDHLVVARDGWFSFTEGRIARRSGP